MSSNSNEVKPMRPNTDSSITPPSAILDISPANPDPGRNNLIPVLSKDIPINQQNNTWARVYLRRPENDDIPTTKQPLIVYYHGGGFILGSVATSMFHKFCNELAEEVPAVIVSVEYRLAPKHRLPAAYDDCMEALRWISTAGEEWLTKYADFSKCFLMGSSSGGNIVYHVGLRAVTCGDDLMPLKIQGLILHQPSFGGIQRTPSEIRLANDEVCPPSMVDIMWGQALPIGAHRDHEYCNPMVGIKSDLLKKMKDQRWKVMVTGCDGDPFVDREIEFVKMLKENGVDVVGVFTEGGCHGVEGFDESKARVLYGVLKNFLLS